MPELPEVETMRRGIGEIVGSTIDAIEAMRSQRLKPITITPPLPVFRREANGKRVDDVERLGKRVVLRLENRSAIVIEPRMTGLVVIGDAPSKEHLRMEFHLRGKHVHRLGYWDRRGLGTVRLFQEDEMRSRFSAPHLGPDALRLTQDQLRTQLGKCRRPLKVALLDQALIAGIGNLYASEILHVAGIHPEKKCQFLSREMWAQLHGAIQQVLHAAIRHEGSTLADGTYRNALSNPGSYQNHHRVYQKHGEICPTCHEERIRRAVHAQRSTFYCPGCQTKSARGWK